MGRIALVWPSNLGDGPEQLSQGGIDVVLLDLGLPESSGAQSYAWVQQLAPEIPVIVLTGDWREQTEVSLLTGGARDFW